MNTIAELKRRMTVGTVVHVENHRFPHLSGERTILIAQTKAWAMTYPKGHPDAEKYSNTTWLDIPKRDQCEFNGDSVTIDGWLTIALPTVR